MQAGLVNPKHVAIRIQQCLALAEASNCPRRKFGALLLDPERNVILVDGYNGGPRGGGHLCGSLQGAEFCTRRGLLPEDIQIQESPGSEEEDPGSDRLIVRAMGALMYRGSQCVMTREEAQAFKEELLAAHPPIESGTRIEFGCHHAEMNVICNAAAGGIKTTGAWLLITGEPCMICSKLIHHAGITHVLVVDGGYIGHNGVGYLESHGVRVTRLDGPKDPRLSAELGVSR